MIEEIHFAARQNKVHLGKLMTKLGQRTEELADWMRERCDASEMSST